MRKQYLIFSLIICLVLSVPCIAYGNMAAPSDSDIGTAITLESNDEIAVVSEVLDITVTGDKAEITATYEMRNTKDEAVITSSMFLSPNIESGEVEVLIDGAGIPFAVESYQLSYDTSIITQEWQYAVLGKITDDENETRTVDSILFEMEFEPMEEREIVVSYIYQLGGYPTYDFNAKSGRIEYYLTPAAMWKDFENLTINLYLDKEMPIISESNLEFEKVETRTYQYVSDTLPEEELYIVIDENWVQNISSTLRSPYLPMLAMLMSPVIIITLILVVILVIYFRKDKKKD